MIARIRSDIAYRFRTLFNRNAVEQELNSEFEFHIEREVAKLMREGMSKAEAERHARASFGGVERIKDDTRDAHGISFFEQAGQDIRYAVRGLAARKAFTFGVVATLALAIGANATMFGVVDRLLFRAPQSLRDPGTVHRLYRHTIDQGQPRADRNFSFAIYLDLKQSLKSFDDIAAFQTTRQAVGEGEGVREVPVTFASASFFSFFDAQPAAGRFFTAAEDSIPEGTLVVVLGYGFWQSQFGGRADVVGQQVRVGSKLYTIIGVAPEGFVGMSDQGVPAMFAPITTYAFAARGAVYPRRYSWSWLEMIVRRKTDVSIEAAQADLTRGFVESWRTANATSPQAGFGSPEGRQIRGELTPIHFNRGPQATRDSQVAKWIAGVAIIVLLIACANVANLLLSRAVNRRREIAVRLALGVSRGRLTRQLLTESLLLAVFGGLGGLAIAQWGAASLRRWFLPADLDVGVFTDTRTLIFSAAATIIAALATGIIPAWRAGRADVSKALRAGVREGGQQHSRMRTGLLVFQVALSAVLLVGAGLFVRSLNKVYSYRMGYDVDQVLFATMRPRGVQLKREELTPLTERMLAAARSVPGVTYATRVQSVPFMANDVRGLLAPGQDSVNSRGRFILQIGSPEYFATTGTRILQGRAFDSTDRRGTMPVVVVSEGMAKAIWRGQDALGQCLRFEPDAAEQTPCMTVVGIAEEMHLRSFADAREFSYYVPALQVDEPAEPQMLVRTSGISADMVQPLRVRLQAEMPGAAYISVFPMSRLVEPNFRAWKLGATMFVAFGGLALVLAAVGLYSVMAYDVAQRKRELSVRIALGATMSRVIGLIVGRGVALVAVGLVIGSGFAYWAAPWIQAQMWQQSPRDPAVFGVVVAALFAVGALATAAPAFRASRVDPNTALREE